MTQEEIKALNEALAKGNETLANYIKGLNPTDPVLTLDGVKKFLEENEEGKKHLQSMTDKRVTEGIETFKKNNLQALIDAEYKKQHPETKPEDETLRKVQEELENMKAEKLRTDLKNTGIKYATDKKLPIDLVDYFIGTDENATKANLDSLATILETHDKVIKEDLLKQHSYTPPEGGSGSKDSIAQKILEQNKSTDSNLETAKENYFK